MINEQRVCLTIAGLDPSGGAGVVADIRTFTAFGLQTAAAVTSITFQNSKAVNGFAHLTGEQVVSQIAPVFQEFDIAAVKIGMMPTADIVRSVAAALKPSGARNIVIDPVMASSSGTDLIEPDAVDEIVKELLPLATVITPNIPEAERLTGIPINDEGDVRRAAEIMLRTGAQSVLVKGGHFETDAERSRDFLSTIDGISVFESRRIDNVNVRGTGCMLSSAIAANLALGHELNKAVGIAKEYVHRRIATAGEMNLSNGRVTNSA